MRNALHPGFCSAATSKARLAALALAVLSNAGSVAAEAPPAPSIAELKAQVQTQVQTMLDHLAPGTSPSQRRQLEDSRVFEAPLTAAAIERAEAVHRVVRRRSLSVPERFGPEQPLDVRFANYTIGEDGRVVPGSTGWTTAERRRFSRFLTRMLPIIRDLYGDPYQRWTITLVKDLYYSSSWIFIPSVLEIHTDGSWEPRLLVHEFIHAFRGQRLLTSDANWSYVPTLSGFEEGFAEGFAYLAMNAYVARHCREGDCSLADVPSYSFWDSSSESNYDFLNDESLTCEDFWSEYGGTLKVRERYAAAAAAVMRLQAAVPSFGRRFNEEYYARIRADDAYRPSRDEVIAVIEATAPILDGMPAREWADRQHIFDSRTQHGKRVWASTFTPYSWITDRRVTAIYFLETFPGGSEWAEYIPDCPLVPGGTGPWLYFRHHGTGVRVDVGPALVARPLKTFFAVTQIPPGVTSRARGCNDVPAAFAMVELQWVHDPDDCAGFSVPQAMCFPERRRFGLYRIGTSWQNPQYGQSPGPPSYAMPYDAEQATVSSRHWALAGQVPHDYDPNRHWFLGGVVGGRSGAVTITHSERPGVVTARVANGAFHAAIPTCDTWPADDSCWVRPYAAWTREFASVPGTLTFRFEDDDGSRFEEQRTIVFGNRGHHEFLLRAP